MSALRPEDKIIKVVDGVSTNTQLTILTTSGDVNPAAVQFVDGTGTPITSFGGGTQYTDGGVTVAHPVGTIPVFDNAGIITAVSATNPLPVSATISTAGIATSTKQSDGSQKTQIVDGSGNVIGSTSNALDINIKSGNPTSITANAGTNLNTSTLALETTQTAQNTLIGAVTETAPASDTASSGLNGRLQRIAQRVTSLIALLPAALGAGGGLKVDGSGTALPISLPTDTAPATQNITVVDSASTTTLGANNQSIITGSPTANSTASFSLSGVDTIRVQITGTWTGTLMSEMSVDSGTTWTILGLHQGAYTSGAFTANLIGGANVAGVTNYRVRATSAMTGTATVKIIGSVNESSVYIANAAPSGNVISTLNSSTATLLAAAVFTGTGEDVSNFSEIRVTVTASHASATDGLSIQQSSDNTNWDITDTYTIPATTGKTFAVPRQARYYRVVYTNGGTNQTTFRLQSILNRTGAVSSSQRASDTYSNENDLEQTWAFNSLYNGATWDRMRGDITNGLDVDITRLPTLVAGTAIIGKVGIDQTTPGTTNGVQINAALPAGTNAIGKLAANSGVDIGDVDVTTVGTITPGTAAANLGKAEDAGHVTGDTGVFILGVRNDDGSALSNTDKDYTPIGVRPNGAVTSSLIPTTFGGLTTYHLVSAGSTNATNVKNSQGQLYGWYIYNSNAAARKVAFHNTAGTPTAGASVFFSLVIPPTSGANVFSETGIQFSAGIGISTVTDLTDAGTTAVAANDLIINLFYT